VDPTASAFRSSARHSATARRRSKRRFDSGRSRLSLTAAGAVGCLVLQLAGISHQVVVRHSRCAEHGELVHGDAPHGALAGAAARRDDANRFGSASDAGSSAAAEGRRDGVARFERAAESGPDEHEHCAVLSDQRKVLAATRAPVICARELSISSAAVLHASGDAGRRVLSFAPKTSPPTFG
jgi:hypothetical protein